MNCKISVVIPTCNRRASLNRLLKSLILSTYPVTEVIIIDSGEDKPTKAEFAEFSKLNISYLYSEKSVCKQRNLGIGKAANDWIFMCDDDIEVPADYLSALVKHVQQYPDAGAVSGLVMQKEKNEWISNYPERSSKAILWKYIFRLGIWGPILYKGKNKLIRRIKKRYEEKSNHIAQSGWPVLVDFSGEYFTTPVYGIGAALIRKKWLLQSPYDEFLDNHGIGDNYGVSIGFPFPGVHVLNTTHVYHYQEETNRLKKPVQYLKRMLALDYFMSTRKELKSTKKISLLWSQVGNFITFLYSRQFRMSGAAIKTIWILCFGKNPYMIAARKHQSNNSTL